MKAIRPRTLVCFGTRPEAIKMFPAIEALRARQSFDVRVAVTAQHREMLDQVLSMAGIVPDIDLDLMRPRQALDELASRILTGFGKVLDEERPDRVLVHGDTLTTMIVALACYFRKVPVGHVEAGLRSGDIHAPWPEEANRRITAVVTDLHIAPTDRAAQALRAENVPASQIHLTGNTVIDALHATRAILAQKPQLAARIEAIAARFPGRRIIGVTAHRRENFGAPMRAIARALAKLATREDVTIIYPLHPNPQVSEVMQEQLGDSKNIALLSPLEYPEFVRLMVLSDLLLTDSGGIQEEAPALGKPVLVMRETTERPEAIEAGTARLVGTRSDRIVEQANRLLNDADAYRAMARAHNPFGDGTAARKIADVLAASHGCSQPG